MGQLLHRCDDVELDVVSCVLQHTVHRTHQSAQAEPVAGNEHSHCRIPTPAGVCNVNLHSRTSLELTTFCVPESGSLAEKS
jgi:hypothetical protein